MGITSKTVEKITVEYGDQYKVSAPADADKFEKIDSLEDLFG